MPTPSTVASGRILPSAVPVAVTVAEAANSCVLDAPAVPVAVAVPAPSMVIKAVIEPAAVPVAVAVALADIACVLDIAAVPLAVPVAEAANVR